jgi:N-acetylmuramoyl-L-alanine amidase
MHIRRFPVFPRVCTGLLTGFLVGAAFAQPVRMAPMRPNPVISPSREASPVVTRKFSEYVRVGEFARQNELMLSWMEPGKRVLLQNEEARIEIEAGSRDMRVNGLRVFLGDPSRMIDGELKISRIDSERLLPGLLRPAAHGGRELKVIAIDPGHGGTDTGTQNETHKLQEKVFALDVAVRLKKVLEARGYRIVMTRETDIEVGLGARAIIANQAKADLFISVHFNSVRNDTKTSGAEVFTFAPQFQRSTNAWGKGQADDTEGLPAPVNRFDLLNAACAHAIHCALIKSLKVEDRGQKIAHWGVLRPLNCPGVLVEAGFLSNEVEGKKIATPEYRQQIAEAIAEGVKAYAAAIAAAK